ncbi:hypothetical protein [Mangrovimonas sp. ST2L15]|uniref:hypothetical protein n=1 Tax=Mangrovimonas sp. ST2L15 TaxID=1645916 RepID=UPI0006B65396|nr:hypothetical protein [Mangrovimonas sp. ST2L15]
MELNKLHKTQNGPFKVPQNYFEELEEQVMDLVKLKSKISDSGFQIPENYLEHFEFQVPTHKNKQAPKVISLFNRKVIISTISIAASVLILMNLSIFQKNAVTFGDIDTLTLETYLLNQEDKLQWETMVSDYDELSSSILEQVVNDDQLEDYLLNATDIEDLIQEEQ